MSTFSNGGVFNPAYHDSETLEIDKRSPSRSRHTNPYAGDWSGVRPDVYPPTELSRDTARAQWGGRHEQSWDGGTGIPMDLLSTHPVNPAWRPEHDHSSFQIMTEAHYEQSLSIHMASLPSGNMTMRWRGLTMRRMFQNGDPNLQIAENNIMTQVENEQMNLVRELVAMSTRDRVRAIQDLPMSFQEKKHIRNQVLSLISSKKSRQFTCLGDCSEQFSRSFRKCGSNVRSARQTLELWQGTMKEIGGKFGTSVLSYFIFLKWLFMFNVFSFLVNFGFITIPQLVYDSSPNIPANTSFRGLELLTGAGYFNYTVMYYGSYSNETLIGAMDYKMQLGYFFTIAVYMLLCGIALIFSMANSFRKNYVLADSTSSGAWQLLCSWDFSITNERAVRQRKNNLRIQLKESLSEKAQHEQLTSSEKLKHFGIYLGSWLLSTSLTVGCGASIFFLCQYEIKHMLDTGRWSLLQEAETLLVPFVVSLMNMVIPLFYSLFNKFEHYSSQRRQIYALVLRNVLFRMCILGVLCYYWMNVVAVQFLCWESVVGQALYRLVIVDFIFLMLGSFFGEFLSNVVGTRLLPRLGVPEFDVARNVLEIIYAQTLAWIGIYFSPLLPAIQILKFFILFYIKKVSLMHNCQPPRRTGRAAQMKTIFTALLFFPFFLGALSIVGYTTWSLTPSEHCGPFRGLNSTFSVVEVWIKEVEAIPGSKWVVFIYQKVIRSEIFYFLITIIILIIVYIFWQVSQGRKQLIVLLRRQIVNEGKDKSFLLEKLQNLQKSQPNKRPKQKKSKTKPHQEDFSSNGSSNSNAMVQVLLARQRAEEEDERERARGLPVPLESTNLTQAVNHRRQQSSSSALAIAMQARQRAESQTREEYYTRAGFTENHVNYRHTAEEQEENSPTSVNSVMMQVIQARQRADEEEEEELKRMQWVPAAPQNSAPSSALIQAMLARQQAQNEYDDGY
ncbi:transmembrane channel-like protein 5 isoform X2 [Periophthalmus magnuspinnatus]|uniref:transmembrane channel-like protein 5 isoform X2 n=1 Tax=Periophthalmus magnuspinnatus TaxID=409849 RepID=UPI00145B11EA|nr:transmembrane channel-like protein 5 isoform X2 [Periophthalmus magnuspinnatus]